MQMERESFEIVKLIKEIYGSMNTTIGQEMKESGLTPQQIMIIKVIAHEKEVTLSRICGELSLAKATVSGSIQRLEEAGYIVKEKKATDKRNTYISFSEKGRQFAQAFRKEMNQSFCKVFEKLTQDEVREIESALKLLSDKIKEENR
ncbi:MAG: MarR family winged helix-turn-helix transcriptional regulator [Cellulosilyticaceae bacterium]